MRCEIDLLNECNGCNGMRQVCTEEDEEDDYEEDKNWDYMRGEPRCLVCGEAISQCDCTL